MFRRCSICNNRATKFFVHSVLDLDNILLPTPPPEDRMEGFYCDDCYANKMIGYAVSLKPGLMGKTTSTSTIEPYGCPYCSNRYNTYGELQSHRDAKHSDVDGHVAIAIEDPAKKAQEILNEDSKRWADEYITPPLEWAAEYETPPLDTPPEKANERLKELREMNERLDRGDYNKDKDRIWEMFEQKGATTTEERHKRILELAQEWGIERLRRAAPLWAEFAEKQMIREEWLKNKPPKIPPEKMHGLGPVAREALKAAQEREQVLKCDQCSMVFHSNTSLANHRRAHERRIEMAKRLEMAKQQDKEFYEEVNKKYEDKGKKRGRPKKESKKGSNPS